MKTALLTALLVLLLFTESTCQVIGYYLPAKKLRITVTYLLTGYALEDGSGKETEIPDSKYDMVIDGDVKVEEIIVPDPNRYFEISIPQQLTKGGARFEWAFKLDRNGILSGWNAAREPLGAAVLSGGIGLVVNVITGITSLRGLTPALAETPYKVTTKQKITVTDIIDIPSGGISEKVVAVPELDSDVTKVLPAFPAVSVAITESGIGTTVAADQTSESRDVLHYILPTYYRLVVSTRQNGLLKNGRLIDHLLIVPQHGQLKSIAMSELFRGRKAASVSIDPATGQLLTWQYARSGNPAAELTNISKQLDALNEAIAALAAAQDQKLKQEVTRLELEVEKRELEQELKE